MKELWEVIEELEKEKQRLLKETERLLELSDKLSATQAVELLINQILTLIKKYEAVVEVVKVIEKYEAFPMDTEGRELSVKKIEEETIN